MLIQGFNDLSYLNGEEVIFIRGLSQLTELEMTKLPDRTFIVKDYGDAVLIDMVFERDYWGLDKPPRHIKKMIPKGALLTGDVVIKANGEYLTGRKVGNYGITV